MQTLETWLWDAVGIIRGRLDTPKFKGSTWPLFFCTRFRDVFDDEVRRRGPALGGKKTLRHLLAQERQRGPVSLVRFFTPKHARGEAARRQTTSLGQYLTATVTHGSFSFFAFLRDPFVASVLEHQRGASKPSFTATYLTRGSIPFPHLPEQRKITRIP